MKLAIGLLLNLLAFILAALGYVVIAVAVYAASVILLAWPRKMEEKKIEPPREPTPDEIKKRPVTAPEV